MVGYCAADPRHHLARPLPSALPSPSVSQRYRDALKLWVSGGEVKNKQPLLDARASIERRMETFKVVERETKTKAYSKEGLARDATLTPEERRRLGTRQWVQEFVQALEDEVDATEAEVEALEAVSGGKKKEREANLARLNGLITNHRWHIDRLEALTRMLDNAAVDPDAVDGIKEDLEYYQEQVRGCVCVCLSVCLGPRVPPGAGARPRLPVCGFVCLSVCVCVCFGLRHA